MSEITETCPMCTGTGSMPTIIDCDVIVEPCPMCHGFGEIDQDPPTCKSCGKTLHDHIGHEGLCRQLEEAKGYIRYSIEKLRDAGFERMPDAMKRFLKELEVSK